MSDDRINQLESLYAAPAGSPGETLFGGQGLLRNTGNLIAAPVRGLVQGTGQLALQGMQLSEEYQQSQDTMSAYTATGDTAKVLKDMVADEQRDIEDTKNRQLALSNATRPNPYTSGIAQNTLYGAADFLTRTVPASIVVGPIGGALIGGGSVGMQTYNESTAQGIDGDTAAKMGLVQGGTAAAMTFLPMSFGGGLGKRMVAGAVLNTGYSIGGNLAAAKVLDDAGYHDQAEQYKQITAAGVLADIVTGSVFGGMHVEGRQLADNPTLVDAAAQTGSDARYQVEAAPGAPVDSVSTQAHAAAMDMAREQLLRDEPVNLGDIHKDSTFIPIEDPANRAQSLEALREAGYEPPAPGRLTDAQIERRFAERMSDYEGARLAYSDIAETEGGKVLSTDIARELSEDYLADRTRSAAVHEEASKFIKQAYADALAREPQPWENPDVLFTAGGTGAGKTTGIRDVPALQEAKTSAQIVYDTNMNNLDSADAKIQQALAAGKNVHIVYTFRDPLDALTNGALPRAERQRAEFGSGRTVPIDEHAATHAGSFEAVRQLAEKYKDDPRVRVDAIDNSRGKGNAVQVPLESLTYPSDTATRENMLREMDREHQEGRIGPETYQGFAGRPAPERGAAERVPEARGSTNAGNRGSSEQADQAREVSPEEAAARQIAEDNPDKLVTYVDENGNEVTERVSDALSRADAESQEIGKFSDAVKAAVACFARFGE